MQQPCMRAKHLMSAKIKPMLGAAMAPALFCRWLCVGSGAREITSGVRSLPVVAALGVLAAQAGPGGVVGAGYGGWLPCCGQLLT
jgi:hypothetical protein